MKKLLLLLVLLIGAKLPVFATHVRAGEFAYKWLHGNTFQVTIKTYTEIYYGLTADQPNLAFCWGDGFCDTLNRTMYPTIAFGTTTQAIYEIRQNIYTGIHTYAGFGIYGLSLQDVNRVDDILNFVNSVQTPLFVSDTLYFMDPSIYGPPNSSPVLASYAVDFGYVGQVFHHYPAAYDLNGDSLHFEFYTPLQDAGTPVAQWVSPNLVLAPFGTFTIDNLTGDVTWAVPQKLGFYNIGIRIVQYRKVYNNGVPTYYKIGSEMRDLQIIISPPLPKPPPVVVVNDTCVIAGTHITKIITATDPEPNENITITMDGGPFEVTTSPATATQTYTGIGLSRALFDWQTVCDHSNPSYYQVLIRATNNDTYPLTTTVLWQIKVVAPPPIADSAVPKGNSIVVNWQYPYKCDSANSTRFMGYSVWRREGSNPFKIDSCTPGLAGEGYTEIAANVPGYSYTDNTVELGNEYCYRLLANFGGTTALGYVVQFTQSLASNEVCTQLKKSLPVITKASVDTTNLINGSIKVGWSNPLPVLLDTSIQHPGPYAYKVFRFSKSNESDSVLIDSIHSQFFKGLDSTYIDSPLNTKSSPWSYFVNFYSANKYVGQTQSASSIFLTLTSAGKQLTLNWTENVPWVNDTFYIWRAKDTTGKFVLITDTVTTPPYTDRGLTNDSTYCYLVMSKGHYADSSIPEPIINWSQEDCGVPIDTIGPCPPTLTVSNECNSVAYPQGPYTDSLTWTKPADSCGGGARKYYIYYSAKGTYPFTLIDSSHFVNETTFTYHLSNTVAGCYAVAAVDSYYVRGPFSNIVCVENCPEYNLPNTFTPNGDGHNDNFVPIEPYRYIHKVEMKIYTSWGSLVFQTTDPAINWDGNIASTGKAAPDGTYYYVCEVYEEGTADDSNNKPSKTLSGFIHLYR